MLVHSYLVPSKRKAGWEVSQDPHARRRASNGNWSSNWPTGPKWVIRVVLRDRGTAVDFRYCPLATVSMRWCNMTRWATSGHLRKIVSPKSGVLRKLVHPGTARSEIKRWLAFWNNNDCRPRCLLDLVSATLWIRGHTPLTMRRPNEQVQ